MYGFRPFGLDRGMTILCCLYCVTLAQTPHRHALEHFTLDHNAIIRGDSLQKKIALVFTGGDYADGGHCIRNVLWKENIKAGFFFTGDFCRRTDNAQLIHQLVQDGHYLGPHSDRHLLYCDWDKRDSSLVTREIFENDLIANYRTMESLGVHHDAYVFIPPYEWYNHDHVAWASAMGITLFNYTPGIGSQADYTTPNMTNYRSSEILFNRLFDFESKDPHGLNGAIILIHIGTHPARTDKFYIMLEPVLAGLRGKGYRFVRIDSLLTNL
jgi:peptidoglycan/xylan/chitin deacetylase (PgdA/CDA1 family)